MSQGIAAEFASLSLALTLTITGSGAPQKRNGCSPLWSRAAEPWTERT